MSVLPASTLPWTTYRDVRLRALASDPGAFGSSIEREQAFPDGRWRARAATAGTFLWMAPDEEASSMATGRARHADGLIGLFPATDYLTKPESPQVQEIFGGPAERLAFVTQMWVAPERRGSGAFEELMDAVIAHAVVTGVHVIALHVYRTIRAPPPRTGASGSPSRPARRSAHPKRTNTPSRSPDGR